jgi:hypothetical protein
MASSAHEGLFNTLAGFVHTSLGMPPKYMITTNTEAPVRDKSPGYHKEATHEKKEV